MKSKSQQDMRQPAQQGLVCSGANQKAGLRWTKHRPKQAEADAAAESVPETAEAEANTGDMEPQPQPQE